MSGPTIKELATSTDKLFNRLRGMARRVSVAATSKAFAWVIEGVSAAAAGRTETFGVDLFGVIGIYARPGASGKPEAVVVNVGNAKHPAIVATRDHAGLKAILAALGGGKPAAGETLVYSAEGGVVLYLKTDGTVEARTAGGTAVALATKAEVKALRDFAADLFYGGSGAAKVLGWPDITGTTVLKGE